jgi:2-deoxy-D-gluconate 3-dehydrogenase
MLSRSSGKVIVIASVLTFQGGILVPSYTAAKVGVGQLTKAFANEGASKGGNVNAIASGYSPETTPQQYGQTRSVPVKSWNGFPLDIGVAPGDLSGAIVFLASRASDYGTAMCGCRRRLVEPLIPKTITIASICIPR